jgi:hypothetical protein
MRKNILGVTLAAALAAGGSAYAQQTESTDFMILAEPVEYVILEPVQVVEIVPAEPIVMSYTVHESFPEASIVETRVLAPDQGWLLIESSSADSAFPRGSTQSD